LHDRLSRKIGLFHIFLISIISGRDYSDPDDYDESFREAGRAGGAGTPDESAQRGLPVAPILTTPGTSASVQDGRV
jgi:hypothetical protein